MDGLWFVAGLLAGLVLTTVYAMTVLLSMEPWVEEESDENP